MIKIEVNKTVKGVSTKIYYVAKRNIIGLSDVTTNIYNGVGSQVITGSAMIEVGSTGVYYFDYTPGTSGRHIIYADSASQPRSEYQALWVEDYGDTAEDIWTYERNKRTVFGGGGKVIPFLDFSEKERKLIVKGMKKVPLMIDEMAEKLDGEIKLLLSSLDDVKAKIKILEKELGEHASVLANLEGNNVIS